MSTLEALNAISEAIEAHKRLPVVEKELHETIDARDFAMLERDEARDEINRLRDIIMKLEAKLEAAEEELYERDNDITDLRSRNANLDTSVTDLLHQVETKTHDLNNKEQIISILSADKTSLLMKLEDSKGVVARLTDTLRNIGQSIVAAVEVPEVTSSSPFPVANPMAMPNSPSDQSNDQSSSEPNGNVAESPRTDLVSDVASGCNVYRYW